jgi:hypothetical protein
MIAGHEFDSRGYCKCGRKWLDIRQASEAEVGMAGYAHAGNLTDYEQKQIEGARMVEDALFARILSWRDAS